LADVEDGSNGVRRIRRRRMVSWRRGRAVGNGVGVIRFKVGDVKGRMDAHSEGKVEAVGMGRDFGFDGKGTETDMIKLGGGARGGEVAAEKPDEVTGLKGGERTAAGVVVTGLGMLGITEYSGKSSMKVLEVGEVGVSGRGFRKPGVREDSGKGGRVETVGEVEGSVTGGGMDGVVVGKLSMGKEGGPGGLLEVDKDAEELLKGLVQTFGLTVSLGVEGGGHGGLDVTEGEKSFPEVGGEEGIAV